jgi:hypothetical protein
MIVLDLSASGAEGLAPAGWVVRVTMPAGPPMLYAAMFSAPSDAIIGVRQHRQTQGEKYEAIKALGPSYVERRKLAAGHVVEISKGLA